MSKKIIKVLLVDDEDDFVSTLAERLELREYYVKIAKDGESGISKVSDISFDIVILDLMMPGLTGIDTLKQIKTIDNDLPVILLTGHGSTKEAMEGMAIGAFDFLMKPIDIKELIDKIKEAVNQ